jgi:hypothetical protein
MAQGTIVGRQGSNRYLVHVSGPASPEGIGRVLDLDQQTYFPEQPIGQITGRGYWEELTVTDPKFLDRMLARIGVTEP